jgi:hypothetical protein
VIGDHAGYCIGGPWNARQLADKRDRVEVLFLPPIGSPDKNSETNITIDGGEYRWDDGSWIWHWW